jgi:hypothetical protein
VKYKNGNNFKQNIDETHSEQPKIHRKIHNSLWRLKIQEPKVSIRLPNVCDFQNKNEKSVENL